MKYIAEINDDNVVISTYTIDDKFPVISPMFEITQEEYETNSIAQVKIDTAVTAYNKETELDKLIDKKKTILAIDELVKEEQLKPTPDAKLIEDLNKKKSALEGKK